jgi:hypothetical protein
MARDEAPPFERGDTWYGGDTPDTADLGAANIIGKEWVFEDIDPNNGTTFRTAGFVRCRAVRNVSGITLAGKRLVTFSTTAGEYGVAVNGYATITAAECYPLDEYLTSVVDDDVCWIVIEGPAVVKNGLTAGDQTNFAVGAWLVSQTAATSQAATAGYAEAQLTAGTDTALGQILNRIGRAMTARTTANTGSDVLCWVGKW